MESFYDDVEYVSPKDNFGDEQTVVNSSSSKQLKEEDTEKENGYQSLKLVF